MRLPLLGLPMLGLLLSLTALSQAPRQNPLDTVFQAYWQARGQARYDEASALREEARGLLAKAPVEAPQFANWVQSVAQLYQGVGLYARAREVAEAALARTGRLGDAHPTRIALVNMVASDWEQDRNLLKAVSYLEKMASALEAAPAPNSAAPPSAAVNKASFFASTGASSAFIYGPIYRSGRPSNLSGVYQRLAAVYQRLGRPDAVAAVLAKMKNQAGVNDYVLASLYESQGRFDEAAALFQKQLTQAAGDPQQMAGALQSLAGVYLQEQQYGDAAEALQQAIRSLDGIATPPARSQSLAMRQNLADILRQGGKIGEADQVYQQLLSQSQSSQDPNYPQVLNNYANYLENTDRGAKAESLLSDYLASHPALEPWQESNLLSSLAVAARAAGDSDRAAEYERAAADKQQAARGTPDEQSSLLPLLQKANAAASGGNPEEAFSLTLEALAAAPQASDREQIAWQVPGIAGILAAKSPAKADQLYQHLFGIVRSWSSDSLQPLLNVAQNYPRFLMGQKDRLTEVPEAIEAYRKALMNARGEGTGHLWEPLQMTIDYERFHGSAKRAMLAAQDLLALEESLNGSTSEGYLDALETQAGLYEAGNENERAVRLHRQTVAIGDLVYSANDARRGSTRTRLAFGLAREQQFDEAERLAREAVAIGQQMHPSQAAQFTPQLETIRKMRAGAEKP